MALLVKARTCSIALERRQRASVITPRRLNDPLPELSLTVLMSVVCAAYFPRITMVIAYCSRRHLTSLS